MLIYSKNGALVDGVVGHYRNPAYFEKAENVDKVMIIGDYPHVKKAYEQKGVEIVGDVADDDAPDGDTKPKRTRKPKEQVE